MARTKSDERTIRIAKYFLWVSSLLIIFVGLMLSIFIGRATYNNIVRSQEAYLEILAEDFNAQLFRRFTLEVVRSGENVALADEEQYELLDNTVSSMLSGLKINDVSILTENGQRVYSATPEYVGKEDNNIDNYSSLYEGKQDLIFYESDTLSTLDALFQFEVPEGSVLATIYFPLSISDEFSTTFQSESILGILSITIDISSSYQDVLRAQRTIFYVFFFAVIFLFSIVQYVAGRATQSIKRHIKENKSLEDKLYQQEKLASMGRVVASISHELRNPLGILQSSSELLRTRNAETLDMSSNKILDIMIDEIKRLGNIVTEFIDYAKPKKINYENVNLSFVIHKAITFLEQKIIDNGIYLGLNIDENISIKGEENLLYRIFYNLITNSIQALEGIEKPSIIIEVNKHKNLVTVKITDNGHGFTEEALAKALDPFYTTKDEGIGLGLAIVYSVVEAHNASMKIYNININEQVNGACIEITFPKK